MPPDDGGTFLARQCVVMAWFPLELIDAVVCCTQYSRVIEPGNKNNSTQWHDTCNILTEPRVRAEVDAACEKMLDPIARSLATKQSVAGINNLFVDDLFGTSGTEMEQRVFARLGKDFQGCSEDWNDVTFTAQRIVGRRILNQDHALGLAKERPEELEEISAERNTKENLYRTPAMRTK